MPQHIEGTLAERVCRQLIDAIVTGELQPGSKVSEESLAHRFGVSRAPLREALRRLEEYRLVERKPHAGARVVSLSREELAELYEIREALEGMACRLAAERMSEEELQELAKVLDAHEQRDEIVEGRSYFQEGDEDFHLCIIRGSQNQKLMSLVGGNLYHLIRMYRYQLSMQPTRPQKALKEHRMIFEAISARDGELAELLMRRHLSRASKQAVAFPAGREENVA